MSTTPNMTLILPVPGVGGTAGPQYASMNNTAFEAIDAHDHTPGKGVRVPSAGININADLSFNSNNIDSLRTLRLASQASTPIGANDIRIVYSKNGELAYRDASGNEVLITSAGSVAGATGTIAGLSSPASASYSSVNKDFTWRFDAAKIAAMNVGDIRIYPFDATNSYANFITLKAKTAVASSFTLYLPAALPSKTSVLTVDTSGNIEAVDAGPGVSPVGAIIPIASHITGAWALPSTGVVKDGWMLCDGAAIPAGNTLSGNVPNLTDDRLIIGSTVAGATGGANSITPTGSVGTALTGTQSLNHSHDMAHVHIWGSHTSSQVKAFTDNSGFNSTSPSSAPEITYRDSFAISTTFPSSSFAYFKDASANFFTAGPLDSSNNLKQNTGTTNLTVNFSNGALASGTLNINAFDNRPKFLTARYIIRVK